MGLEIKKLFKTDPVDASIILICVIRDEYLLLEYFIRHYKQLGVTHFVFIDNNSEDGTLSYLLNRGDINCQVLYTTDSYAKNEYGITWVNEILDTQCKNKWCVVVDVDELIMPRNNESLSDIKIKMEQNDQNVLPTCLIDFYPKHLDATPYKSGTPFYSHSNHYDKFVEGDYMIYPGEGGELVVKGGMRHRVFGANREPVCLTKKSFFKYDFSETHKLAVGMHWLLPRDFDHKANLPWSAYTNWSNMNRHIKLHPSICVLGHFKFIKPNIYEFFNKRVERNQDWGDSDEYRNYISFNKSSFYESGTSVRYSGVQTVYDNVIDRGINKREFLIIISEQRHGTTTLCEKLNDLPQNVNLFEAFNYPTGKFSHLKVKNLASEMEKTLSSESWMNVKYVSFKVFENHKIDIEKLFTCDISMRVVFLRRGLKDSYQSWQRAVTSGNWGTTPDRQIKGEGITGFKLGKDRVVSFENYKTKIDSWFLKCKKLTKKYDISAKEIWFSDITNENSKSNLKDLWQL